MGQTKEQRIIKQLSCAPTVQKFTPIATNMFLPNHSGDHSAGIVRDTPTASLDIVNKAYVDNNFLKYGGEANTASLAIIDADTTKVKKHMYITTNGTDLTFNNSGGQTWLTFNSQGIWYGQEGSDFYDPYYFSFDAPYFSFAGDVGIGLATPTDPLDVNGYITTEGAGGGVKIWNRSSKTGNPWIIYNQSDEMHFYKGSVLYSFTGTHLKSSLPLFVGICSYNTNVTGLTVTQYPTITSGWTMVNSFNCYPQAATNSSADYYTFDCQQITSNTAANYTGTLWGNRAIIRHQGTGTVSNLIGTQMYVDTNSTGNVTNQIGFKVTMANRNASATVTNSYAIYLDAPVKTGTITNCYGIYQAGTEMNYLYGGLSIGALSTTNKLYVYDAVTSSKGANYAMSDSTLYVSQTEGTYASVGQQMSLYKIGANNYTVATGLRGMQMQCLNQGTGNVTSLIGNFIYVANQATSTVTDRTGIYLYASGGAGYNVTTAYGIYIDTQKNTGVTTAYGIYQKDANDLNYFAGTVQAGGYLSSDASAGLSVTITTCKLTAGGANGSMTFKNGLLTAQTAAT